MTISIKATIGVGLGLPGHIPGLADNNIMKEGVRQSEDYQIEQVTSRQTINHFFLNIRPVFKANVYLLH